MTTTTMKTNTTSTDFDAIVIGGGLGGLTAGALLTKRGRKVLLLEQHYIPGGCATTFKRKDYLLEVGLHEMDGLDEGDKTKNAIFKELGVDKNVTFLKVPEFFRYKSSTIDFVHPHGVKEVAEALIEQFPHEEEGIRKYLETIQGVATDGARWPSKLWKQLLVFPAAPFLFPYLIGSANRSLGEVLDELIHDEELKLILAANIGYYHDDPYTMGMMTWSMAQSSFIRGGGNFIQGGSQKLSDYLASVIENEGGQVLLGKKVTRILVENDAACGVAFVDSFNANDLETTVHAQQVIFNGALPLLVDMLPEQQAQVIEKSIGELEIACSLLSMYIGFDKPPKELGNEYYSTFLAGDSMKNLTDLGKNAHAEWSTRSFAFVDYSQIDARLAPEGKAVGAVCGIDYLDEWEGLDAQAYAKKKEDVSQMILHRLEEHIPGITDHIEYYDLGTPKTIKRYILTPEGTAYGFAQTPEQAGLGRPQIKSPVKNLSLVGAWSFPGGGFTGAIISGYLCANHVSKSLKKVPLPPPDIIQDSRYVRLMEKNEIATNTLELIFEKPERFVYEAGQYVVLELEHPEYEEIDMAIRSFSIASHPDEPVLRFTMRKSSSSYKKSVDALHIGERCRVFGPMGDFRVDATNGRGVVFLVSGIGVTPVLPLVKELEKKSFASPTFLFYSNRYEETAAYHEQLQDFALTNFEYVPVTTSKQPRINEKLLKSKLPSSMNDFDYYIVGASDFLHSMEELLLENDVERSSIVIDDFG